MGLAAAKNKRKLGNDPNNTKWARKTDSYGQRLLRAQGWEPGQYLGAQGAAHAEYHTVASSSHIQVVLKDDNLGLGAKRNNGDECTGLDAFQHLLGRLNGKSEEVLESERKAREDVKLNLYVERKLGTIRFVHGGWLVGDELKEIPTEEKTDSQPSFKPESAAVSADETEGSKSDKKKSKKRRADEEGDEEETKKTSKKEKKSKRRKMDAQTGAVDADDTSAESKAERKRKPKKQKFETGEGDTESVPTPLSEAETSVAETKEKPKEKKDKKSKKDKREKKEKRRRKEASEETGEDTEVDKKERKKKKKQKSEPSKASDNEKASAPVMVALGSGVPTPSGSGYSTPITGSSRYLARSRFITQKKLAFTDTTALNQIFMIKS